MSACGRCKGRGAIKPLVGSGITGCPDCDGTGIRKRKPMKRRSGYVPLPEGSRCVVCGEPAVHAHHVVKRQRVDALLPPEAAEACKRDPRGVVALCAHDHDEAEKEALELGPEHLHADFAGFVAEWDLWPALPRYMWKPATRGGGRA